MPNEEVLIHQTIIWIDPNRLYIPAKAIYEIFKDLPNIFGIADDILL